MTFVTPFKTFAAATIVLTLAACGETGEDASIDMSTEPTEVAVDEDALGPPDEAVFAEAYAAACPEAEAVASSICQATGMGGESFVCEYGLGDTEARREEATLVQADGAWVIENPEMACAAEDA
ncbi:MAG: hypothetical protein WA948_01385 [Pontixanthobacter sp.]